jgi:LysM repeat protein
MPTQTGGVFTPDSSNVAAPAAAGGGGYTVVHGDTMWDIAQRHGMSLGQLEALNPQIKDPSLIFPGQTVNLGQSAPTGGVAAPSSVDSGASDLAAPVNPSTSAATDNQVGGSTAQDVLGSAGFPTTSSYPPSESVADSSAKQGLASRIKGLGLKAKGWGGAGTESTDPIQSTFYANGESVRNTNPLDIKDDGRHGQKLG